MVLHLFSCGSHEKHFDDADVFRYNEAAGITSLDPAFSRTFENLWAVNQLFEGLVQLDSDMNIQPAIAESWTISDDGKLYTFKLRKDVFFHDRDDLTKRKVIADDFKYSFERLIDESLASPGSWVFSNVAENGFRVVDERIFEIELTEPFPPFLGILSMKYCSVVPKEAIEKYGEDFRSNPVGTGPFMFKFWEENQLLTMVKNPDYYEKDNSGEPLPYLEAVSITFKKDQNSVFLDFLKGSYDMLQGIEGSYKEELLTESGKLREAYVKSIELDQTPWLKTDYLGFLLDSVVDGVANPLIDIRVRQAINHAIDRKQMTRVLLRNLGFPAMGGFIPEGFPSHTDYFPCYEFSSSKAISLLKEAGYTSTDPLRITLSTTAAYTDLAEFVQFQLNLAGIQVDVSVLESGNLNEMVAQSNLFFFKKSWLADYPDEENFMALFYSSNFCPNGPNYTHFKNDKFDKLYEESILINDPEIRRAKFQEMDSIVAYGQAVAPLFYGQAVKFLQKSIHGLPSSPVNMLDLRRVSKREAN